MNGIGIFAKTFAGTDPADVLRAARAAGFTYVHFNLACVGLPSTPEAVPEGVAAAIAQASRETGVAIVGLSGTTNMSHPDPAARQAARRQLATVIAIAPACGTNFVTLCTGSRDPDDQWRAHPENGSAEAWRDLVAELEAAAAVAQAHGVLLGIEPEAGNVVNNADAARRLLDDLQISSLRIVIDPANLVDGVESERARTVVADAISLLGDRITVAHAKDRDRFGNVVPPGHGIVDFPAFFKDLEGISFNGPIVAHGFSSEDAPNVHAYLKQARTGGLR